MELIIKLLTHIRASLRSMELAFAGSIPADMSRYRTWLLDNEAQTIAVGETAVYSVEIYNPNAVAVYVRMYDVINPNYATDLPLFFIQIPAKESHIVPLTGKTLYAFASYFTIMATSDYSPTLSGAAASTIYVDIRYRFTLPELPEGAEFLTDPEGNYLIDSEGNYLTT
jgi:hypothetical protein